MNLLIKRILAFLPCRRAAVEPEQNYLRQAADFCDLQRRMQELEARSRPG